MLSKKKVKQSIEKLPDLFSIDELIEQLIFTEKVEAGLAQSIGGNVISNEDVKSIIGKWSS